MKQHIAFALPTNKDAIVAALRVLTETPHIREYLTGQDPKALNQAEAALGLTQAAKVVLLMGLDEAHTVLRALALANASPETPRTDRVPNNWVFDRITRQLPP